MGGEVTDLDREVRKGHAEVSDLVVEMLQRHHSASGSSWCRRRRRALSDIYQSRRHTALLRHDAAASVVFAHALAHYRFPLAVSVQLRTPSANVGRGKILARLEGPPESGNVAWSEKQYLPSQLTETR